MWVCWRGGGGVEGRIVRGVGEVRDQLMSERESLKGLGVVDERKSCKRGCGGATLCLRALASSTSLVFTNVAGHAKTHDDQSSMTKKTLRGRRKVRQKQGRSVSTNSTGAVVEDMGKASSHA